MTQPNLLTVGEITLRSELESRIQAALAAIKTGHLWREGHADFDQYLQTLLERLRDNESKK